MKKSGEASSEGAQSPQIQVPPQPEIAPSAHMGSREQAIAAELERLGADLAGLFALGHELLGRVNEPGVSLLLRHAGRELSQGVLSAVAGREPELTAADAEAISENEKHRPTIARALRLHPTHPSVSAWLALHGRLASQAHYAPDRNADPREAAADFRLLVSLIAGRIEPYFDSQDRADELLAVSNPGQSHHGALAEVMVRPTLRSYFFRHLQAVGWLPLLKGHGVFASPPKRRVQPDGAWSLVTWVEGEYLVRIAGAAPESVREILEGVSTSNDNPAVWDVFARALLSIAPADGVALAPRLIEGMKAVPRVVIADSIVEAARHIAKVDVDVALDIADALLWMPRRPAPDPEAEAIGHVSDWILLSRVSDYAAESIVDDLLVPLAVAAPAEVLKLVCKKLRLAIQAMEPAAHAADARHSYFWCGDLESSEARDGLRATLAKVAVEIAVSLAKISENGAQEAYDILGMLPEGIRRRAQLLLIARSSPFLMKQLEDVMVREDIFSWAQPGKEVGELLRCRSQDASAETKAKLLATLQRGPHEADIESSIRWAAEAGESLSREDAIRNWQLRHLRRFTAGVPDFLTPIAAAAGHDGNAADSQELALTEVGWYSGGVTWGRERSPLSAADLHELSDESLAARIAVWEEVEGLDRPSLRGLEDSLEHLSAEDPGRGLRVALDVWRRHAMTRGATGVLRGVRRGFEAGKETPHALVKELLDAIGGPASGSVEGELLSAALDALGASVETVPPESLREYAHLALSFLFPTLESLRDSATEIRTMNGVISAALNDPAGKAMTAAIRLAVRVKRDLRSAEEPYDEESLRVVLRLREAIDGAIKAGGVGGIAARAAIGRWLPQLVWLDGPWWAERAVETIGSGISDPIQNPIWSAYLTGQRFYDETFHELRPFYVQAARQAQPTAPDSQTREWEPERELAEHVIVAYVRGLVQIGSDDLLLEQMAQNVPVQDLTHAYWQLYRGWTDAHAATTEAIPKEAIDRVVALWRWRVQKLRESPGTERTVAEAAGLLWLILVPQLPAQAALDLGFESLRLTRGELPILHSMWDRLAELAPAFPDEVQRLVTLVVDRELASPYPHLSVSEVGPVFSAVFERGSTQARAAALEALHRAGDAGFTELGSLRPNNP